jgi:hypothetical protein
MSLLIVKRKHCIVLDFKSQLKIELAASILHFIILLCRIHPTHLLSRLLRYPKVDPYYRMCTQVEASWIIQSQLKKKPSCPCAMHYFSPTSMDVAPQKTPWRGTQPWSSYPFPLKTPYYAWMRKEEHCYTVAAAPESPLENSRATWCTTSLSRELKSRRKHRHTIR